MEPQNPSAWYEKTWLVILLCIIFFPVGLYALWKNTTISKGWKIAATTAIVLIVIANLGESQKNTVSAAPSPERNTESESASSVSETVESTENDKANAAKEEITEKLKERARRDWPDDYTTQEFWVNQQLEDYDYMLGIPDNSIKSRAQRDWPLDFSTQKFWYNEQIEARERMN